MPPHQKLKIAWDHVVRALIAFNPKKKWGYTECHFSLQAKKEVFMACVACRAGSSFS